MKRVLILILMLAAGAALGWYDVTVNGVVTKTATESGYVYVYNAGTNVVYIELGGYTVSTNLDISMPVRPAASYTSKDKYSVVSVYCLTNGLVDIGVE